MTWLDGRTRGIPDQQEDAQRDASTKSRPGSAAQFLRNGLLSQVIGKFARRTRIRTQDPPIVSRVIRGTARHTPPPLAPGTHDNSSVFGPNWPLLGIAVLMRWPARPTLLRIGSLSTRNPA